MDVREDVQDWGAHPPRQRESVTRVQITRDLFSASTEGGAVRVETIAAAISLVATLELFIRQQREEAKQ